MSSLRAVGLLSHCHHPFVFGAVEGGRFSLGGGQWVGFYDLSPQESVCIQWVN